MPSSRSNESAPDVRGIPLLTAENKCTTLLEMRRMLPRFCTRWIPAALGFAFAAAAVAPPSPASEIRELTQAPTRIVWCQDVGDGADSGAVGNTLRLMGLDTEDSRGERAILEAVTNFARPMITPRGDRVIFSCRPDNGIYIVNWDGTGLRRLANGFAVGVWQDPASGAEWVYGGSWLTNADALFPIQRAPIDQPARIETVWTRTLMHPDNFQLSAAGRFASGNMPWPVCGILEMPDRDWKKFGDGCWPSLAPENINLFWIFDGAHRNLTLFRTDADERWTLPINQAPAIGGFEVYHPRWSNRARFLTMTGPYKRGAGENRIRGGGPEVEIHLGRFDEHFRTVERWVRVTHNNRGDFFPDAWIARSADAAAHAPAVPGPAAHPQAPAGSWPGGAEGLVFLWENRSGKNEICRNDGGTRICRADARGRARYGRYFEMDLAGGWFSTETDTGAQLLAACRNSNRFSLEAVLTPPAASVPGFSQIASFAGVTSVNFALGQDGDRLLLRLNTSDADGLGPAIPLGRLAPGTPQHVAVNYQPGRLTCYLDGQPALLTNTPLGNLEGWQPGDLVFGDSLRPWPGTLDHVAVFSRARTESDAQAGYTALAERLKHRKPARRFTVEARLTDVTQAPAPESIAPYRRALAVDRYALVKAIEGPFPDQQFLAARWAILDGQALDSPARPTNEIRRLVLEPFDEHPELEGERVIVDHEEFLLPLYYEVE